MGGKLILIGVFVKNWFKIHFVIFSIVCMSGTIVSMQRLSSFIGTGTAATLAHNVGLPVATATQTIPTTLTATVTPVAWQNAAAEVVSNATNIAPDVAQTVASTMSAATNNIAAMTQSATIPWPVLDPAFNALSAKTIATATSATIISPALCLLAPAGYGVILARKKYLAHKEQKLLASPETIYQLASEEHEAWQIAAGGSGNSGNNDSSNNDNTSSFWNRSLLTKIMLGLCVTATLKKLLKEDSVDSVALSKKDAEEKLEKLIDFFQNPSEETFGPGMQNYKFTSKSRGELFDVSYHPEEKTTGEYYKIATGYVGKIFPRPNDQELLLVARATFPSRVKTDPEKSIEDIHFTYNQSFPKFLQHSHLNIKALPQETADAIEKYVRTMQKNRWTNVFDTTHPDFVKAASELGVKPEDSNHFELTAGKHGTFYCELPRWNRYGHPFAGCLAKKEFERYYGLHWRTARKLVQKPLPEKDLSDLDRYADLIC